MNPGHSWTGKSERKPGGQGQPDTPANLQEAFEDAWNNAKNNGAQKDHAYPVAIQIKGNNPIHTYIVIIDP